MSTEDAEFRRQLQEEADEMLEDYRAYRKKLKVTHLEMREGKVFRDWVIQKLAFLNILAEETHTIVTNRGEILQNVE